MEQKRQEQSNKLSLRLKELQKCIEVDSNMLDSIKLQGDNSYTRVQIEKITNKNKERNDEIKIIQDKLSGIKFGKMDQEISDEVATNKEILENKRSIVKQKQEEAKEKKLTNNKTSKKYYELTRDSDKQYRYQTKDIFRAYNYYKRSESTIPDYILSNLKNMPNNKGYFWKSIACFGELPREYNKPTILFEKQRGVLMIHEWERTHYNVYSKKGRERKILLSSTPRKIHRIPRFI